MALRGGGSEDVIVAAPPGEIMPRHPRLDLPGVPQHIIQRGNNRQPCFLQEQDYRCYLRQLDESLGKHGCALHAYVLMTNHVHLLVTPTERSAVASAMQSLGRRYVAYVSATYRRTGTLWEGRYKSCLVDSEHYVLMCYRYIELNPVRAAMVASPAEYRWSSYGANGLGEEDLMLAPHAEYLALGPTSEMRTTAYRDLFRDALGDDRLEEIRTYVQQQRVLGGNRFQVAIQAELGRVTTARPRGRPPKLVTAGNKCL